MPQSDPSSSTEATSIGTTDSRGAPAHTTATGAPDAISIIRHSEKPPDHDDPSGLSVLTGTVPVHRYVATAGGSATVTLDVEAEGQPGPWLLAKNRHTVLVCWEHKHITDITKALSRPISGGDIPGTGPSDRSDIVVAIASDPVGSGTYVCHQIAELPLAGDSIDRIPSASPTDA
ncbi:hypothetical protein [Microlunatus ginsengisoli]|uniref:Uncharacterized protein n=1 Tax=Microlunatus ginsengisoli TaxID=363863 RepID=A0ABP7B080_9ACTN